MRRASTFLSATFEGPARQCEGFAELTAAKSGALRPVITLNGAPPARYLQFERALPAIVPVAPET
jgi:hypothetical protein